MRASASTANALLAKDTTSAKSAATVSADQPSVTTGKTSAKRKPRSQNTCRCHRYRFPHRWTAMCRSYEVSTDDFARLPNGKPDYFENRMEWETGVPKVGPI